MIEIGNYVSVQQYRFRVDCFVLRFLHNLDCSVVPQVFLFWPLYWYCFMFWPLTCITPHLCASQEYCSDPPQLFNNRYLPISVVLYWARIVWCCWFELPMQSAPAACTFWRPNLVQCQHLRVLGAHARLVRLRCGVKNREPTYPPTVLFLVKRNNQIAVPMALLQYPVLHQGHGAVVQYNANCFGCCC